MYLPDLYLYINAKIVLYVFWQQDTFDDYFPKQTSYEDTIWKGLVITALGLGALATVAAVR